MAIINPYARNLSGPMSSEPLPGLGSDATSESRTASIVVYEAVTLAANATADSKINSLSKS